MTVPLVHRTKLVVADHGPAIATVLLVVGVAAFAGAAWTLTHPPTVEVTQPVATQTVGADVETRTVVTGNTSLWDRGTTLENQPVYPLRSAPALTLQVHTSVPSGRSVAVSQELTLVFRASKEGEVFWRSNQSLLAEERVVQDGNLTTTATLDVTQVRAELDAINEELAGIGRARAFLRLNVSYRADGFAGTLSKTAPMTIRQSGYWIGGPLDAENTHQTPVTREVTKPPDLETAVGLGLLGVVSFGGAGGVVFLSRRRLERSAIADELERHRFREWISAGRLGQFATGQDIAMASLKDLVDVAIDSNSRVVHDRRRELFAVVADDVVYYYDPYYTEPELDIESDVRVPVRQDGGQPSAVDRPTRSRGTASGVADRPPESVSVSRDLVVENGQLVATYRLSTEVSEPVVVDVVDRSIRPDGPVAGFEPARTTAVEDGVGFTAAVSPHWTRLVKFAVGTDEPGPPGSGPAVRRVVTMVSPAGTAGSGPSGGTAGERP